jgi:hypothetical protein
VASENHDRTYHNTAVLLPTGQILVGGHAPINTGYGSASTVPGASNNYRDATFEIYDPPYMFFGGRPVISGVSSRYVGYGGTLTLAVHSDSTIAKVMLVRNSALTHLTDADQRTVELPIVGRSGSTITVATPPNAAVAPVGPYMLFVDATSSNGLIPSVAAQVYVTG